MRAVILSSLNLRDELQYFAYIDGQFCHMGTMTHDQFNTAYPQETLEITSLVGREPERYVCSLGDIELSYLVWGDRTKPPVVLVHGGKDHSRNWDWTVAKLIDDYCLITPDMRGHGDSGRSSGGGYAGDIFVSDFAGFMQHLSGQGFSLPLPLIGHSMGGNIVLAYSAAFPENVTRVIAMEGLGYSQKMYDGFMEKAPAERLRSWIERRLGNAAKNPKRFDSPEQMVERMASAHKNLDADQARHLALHAVRKYADGWGWKHDPQFGFFPPAKLTSPEEYGRTYESIECPVLLMRGADSWASDPLKDGRIKSFKNAKSINYPNAGHWLHHDAFDLYIEDVKSFLKE